MGVGDWSTRGPQYGDRAKGEPRGYVGNQYDEHRCIEPDCFEGLVLDDWGTDLCLACDGGVLIACRGGCDEMQSRDALLDGWCAECRADVQGLKNAKERGLIMREWPVSDFTQEDIREHAAELDANTIAAFVALMRSRVAIHQRHIEEAVANDDYDSAARFQLRLGEAASVEFFLDYLLELKASTAEAARRAIDAKVIR